MAAGAVVICILEDLHKERDEAASEAAPGAKEEMDMHRMITGHRMIAALPFLLATAVIFPCLILSTFSLCESTSFPKSINVSSK